MTKVLKPLVTSGRTRLHARMSPNPGPDGKIIFHSARLHPYKDKTSRMVTRVRVDVSDGNHKLGLTSGPGGVMEELSSHTLSGQGAFI